MAYDPVKAHEYYEKYRKKGLKKGRKKGTAKKKGSSKKKAKQTNLVGLSTAGLNDNGRMQAAMVKENIKKEMNEALSKETDPAKRESIRQEYQNKALSEISNLKNNPQYAKAKAAGKGKSGGSSKGEKDEAKKAADQKKAKKKKAAIKKLKGEINSMKSMIANLSPEQKTTMQSTLQSMLKRLKALKG